MHRNKKEKEEEEEENEEDSNREIFPKDRRIYRELQHDLTKSVQGSPVTVTQ